ncbi:hypothetical protein BegalDRAFT_1286 [Beggiatoa alba B18LD]|uniref:HTH cro/C1-type domain-containing protein n=1 Tax=Beggiatoa alba B18LD TaxID=395493 RepID=I3CEZ0_9GAMM|nr:helix-turn-helix transcriptional regulator [Beggiatoa alba]EIJ42183.1 hypothetical protein BegalDRAFT_1286 [Beggiatoa alba B18LD]
MANSLSAVKKTQHLALQVAPQAFAVLLKSYLKRCNINEATFAEALNIRRGTLTRWLNGTVSRPRQRADVIRCATYLNLNAEERNTLLTAAGFPLEHGTRYRMATPSLSFNLGAIQRSPFIIGPPITEPRQFFGREYVLKRIFDVWKCTPLQHIAVVGLKRSGKTSLLHYLRRIIDTPADQLRTGQRNDWLLPGYQWIFVDFQDPRMCYQESLLRHLLVEMNMPVPEPCDLISFMEIIDQYLTIPTIILLDEINAGLAATDLDEQFWWGLRSLGSNHTNGKLGFLLTAHQAPEEMAMDNSKPSPFFNIFGHVLNLGALTETEALALIQSSPIPFSEADTAWIMAESGLWPALLQILCHARLTALQENQTGLAWQVEGLKRMNSYRYLLTQDIS